MSKDDRGRYCGMVEATGEFAPSPPELVGYCGANCNHCRGFEVYGLNKDGIWVCAADSDSEEDW